MKLLSKVMAVFDRMNNLLASLASVILIFLTLAIGLEVVVRVFLNRSINWVPEVSEYGLLFITFLAGAWVLKRERHVIIDLLPNQLSPKAQSLLHFINSIVCTIICLSLTWYSARVTLDYFRAGYYYSTPLETPQFLILGIIPIGSFLLFIQFLRRTFGFLERWRSLSAKGETPRKNT